MSTLTVGTSNAGVFYRLAAIDGSWDDIHNNAADAITNNGFNVSVGWTFWTPTGTVWLFMQRVGLTFNTSALPDDATISAAQLNLYNVAKKNEQPWSADKIQLNVVGFSPTNPASYVVGDMLKGGTSSVGSIEYASVSDTSAVIITLNATGIGMISKTGTTSFMLRLYNDMIDSDPGKTGDTCSGGYGISLVTGTNPIQLSIDYYLPDAAKFRYRKGGTTYKVATRTDDPGGDRLIINAGGTTMFMALVSTSDSSKSDFRVRIGGETKAGILTL